MPPPIRFCNQAGCTDRREARGLCAKHYRRSMRFSSTANRAEASNATARAAFPLIDAPAWTKAHHMSNAALDALIDDIARARRGLGPLRRINQRWYQ